MVWFGSRVLESNVASEGLSAASEEWEKLERFWNERVNQLGVLGETPCGMKEAAGFVHWLRWTPAELPRLKPLILGLISRLADLEQIWETTRLVEYLCDQSTSYPLEAAQLMAALVEVTWPQWLNAEQKKAVISTLLRVRGQRGGEALVNHIVEEMARRHEYEYRRVVTEQGTGE